MEKLFIQTDNGIREYTAEEYALNQLDRQVEELNRQLKEQNKIKKEQLLVKLGITEEEAQLLLGGN